MADGSPPLTLGELLRETRAALAGVDDGALDARLIVETFTATSRTDAVSRPDMPVPPSAIDEVRAAAARRRGGEPVHRILGWREFYGLRLSLSEHTLEPRPDTETLVDAALPHLAGIALQAGVCRILDLGTGTGAVALALLSRIDVATATITDISEGALRTAVANAAALGCGHRVTAVRSDWFGAVDGRFHGIVSNPPYIPHAVVATLDPEVRDFDPEAALSGGPDGLDAYRAIATVAAPHLEPGGIVAVETGYDQRASVTAIFEAAGWRMIAAARDLAGRDRALVFGL